MEEARIKKLIDSFLLNELMDSSSSSSSSDEEFFEIMKVLFPKNKKHRTNDVVKDVIINYTDKDFREKFRLSRETAMKLINMYKCSRHFKERIGFGGRAISVETQCLSFLWFVGNKNSFREDSNLFNFSSSSARRILTNFLEFMFEISKEYIKFPSTAEEKEKTAQEFAKIAGFENVLGCLGFSYISIRKPANKIRSTSMNRATTLILQGICDADGVFLDVFVASPSKLHYSSIYNLSFIAKDLPTNCGSQYHILGGTAYPLRNYLLTPYKDFGNLIDRQKRYNNNHWQTRAKIVNSFRLLKLRFRQLIKLEFLSAEQMCKVVLSCCVLHNLCIMEGDTWDILTQPQKEESQVERATNDPQSDVILQHLGQLKRNEISERF